MADAPAEPVKPTEEQVKEANQAEEQRWQGDFKEEDLKIPYKREVEDEDKGEDSKSEVSGEGENPVEEEEVEVNEAPAPVVTVQDPGEYTPADYSFETTLADGKTVKINTPEEADKLSEEPDNFKTPKQLLDFITRTTSMKNKLDRDKQKWQDQKDTFDSQVEIENGRIETVNAVANEITYLVGKGKLPKVAAEYANADWSDPEVAKQPGVKEQVALLTYMNKENAVRAKAGIKAFGPVDAFTAMQSDEAEQAKITARKEAGEQRKAAGAKVAGVSPTQTGAYVPKGIAVGNPNAFKRGQAVWDNQLTL